MLQSPLPSGLALRRINHDWGHFLITRACARACVSWPQYAPTLGRWRFYSLLPNHLLVRTSSPLISPWQIYLALIMSPSMEILTDMQPRHPCTLESAYAKGWYLWRPRLHVHHLIPDPNPVGSWWHRGAKHLDSLSKESCSWSRKRPLRHTYHCWNRINETKANFCDMIKTHSG